MICHQEALQRVWLTQSSSMAIEAAISAVKNVCVRVDQQRDLRVLNDQSQ